MLLPSLVTEPLVAVQVELFGFRAEDVIGAADDRRIVFDDHHRVARLGEPAQHAREPAGVARMQADGRLVEHVEGARQRTAQRGGERDPLRLASRERARLARERQVPEPHVAEEAEAAADLAQEQVRRSVVRVRLESGEEPFRIRDKHRLRVGERLALDAEQQRRRLEPRAPAVGAGRITPVTREQDADVHPVGLRFEPLEEAADAVPARPPLLAPARLAFPDEAARLLGKIAPRRVGAEPLPLEKPQEVLLAVAVEGRLERLDAASGDGEAGIGNDQVGVDLHRPPEALAGLASADRVVEGEERGGRVGAGQVAAGAVQRFAEAERLFASVDVQLDPALAVTERRLERIDDALAPVPLGADAVEHDGDDAVVRAELRVFQRNGPSPFEHTAEAGLLQRLPQRLRADATHATRKAEEHLLASGSGDQRFEDRGGRVPHHNLTTALAVEHRCTRPKGPEVVGDRGHRADGGPRCADRSGPIDGQRRQDALDPIGGGPIEPLEELPRVRAERLDVPPVSLGVQHVESEAGLAGSGDAGHGCHRADGHANADVLQVVLSSPFNEDESAVHGGGGKVTCEGRQRASERTVLLATPLAMDTVFSGVEFPRPEQPKRPAAQAAARGRMHGSIPHRAGDRDRIWR